MKKAIFIMGVSGVGKSTIAHLLSKKSSIPYFDGDDFHSKDNIDKMASGQPLSDDDRHDWLVRLNQLAKTQLAKNGCIVACSALKQKYRDVLKEGIENNTKWIYLSGSYEQILDRINNRSQHYMPTTLLTSQFDTLEPPLNALHIDISLSPEEIVSIITNDVLSKTQFGIFGLGVMGKSLARNLGRNGYSVSIFNRHVEGIEERVAENFKSQFSELSKAVPFDNIEAFVNSLQKPRKIMLMVHAGKTVDIVIKNLLPYLSENDILIDGGNSNYLKTNERFQYLKTKKIQFIGAGISGGEEGALLGPSIMPSGSLEAYDNIRHYLETIAAKDKNNVACCTYIGTEGSGHFVKMVHNGIEYVEMQLLAEICGVLKSLGKNPDESASILEQWRTNAESYLLEITIDILRKKEDNDWLVHKILDQAGNKGTGNWATIASAQLGVPSTLIASALFARYSSSFKKERVEHDKNFKKTTDKTVEISTNELLEAYQFARIINHYQGFKLLEAASSSFSWNLHLSEIARIWTNGCIIKSHLLEELVEVLKDTNNILNNSKIIQWITAYQTAAQKVAAQCIYTQVAVPCLSESVQFFKGITKGISTANIIQAQRDYFGAHTYQRTDDDSGKSYHTHWR